MSNWRNRLAAWADRRYYANCGTIWWRLWFEVTGQGWVSRKYDRATRPNVKWSDQ